MKSCHPMTPIQITANIPETLFFEILETSPRSVREALFGRFGVKAKKKFGSGGFTARRQEKAKKLHASLKASDGEQDNEVCQELIRNFLFTRRPMLKAALDFAGIKNDDGVTEDDLDPLEKMAKDKVQELLALLDKDFPFEEVRLYLNFIGVPHVEMNAN